MLLSNGQQVKFCQCSGSTSSLIVDKEKYCFSGIVVWRPLYQKVVKLNDIASRRVVRFLSATSRLKSISDEIHKPRLLRIMYTWTELVLFISWKRKNDLSCEVLLRNLGSIWRKRIEHSRLSSGLSIENKCCICCRPINISLKRCQLYSKFVYCGVFCMSFKLY